MCEHFQRRRPRIFGFTSPRPKKVQNTGVQENNFLPTYLLGPAEDFIAQTPKGTPKPSYNLGAQRSSLLSCFPGARTLFPTVSLLPIAPREWSLRTPPEEGASHLNSMVSHFNLYQNHLQLLLHQVWVRVQEFFFLRRSQMMQNHTPHEDQCLSY